MNIKSGIILGFLIIFIGASCTAKPKSAIPSSGKSYFWSVSRAYSDLDSLKSEINHRSDNGDIRSIREYIRLLHFKEQLKASDTFVPVFPTSAGVFNGTFAIDSLSAFDQLIFLYRNLGDRGAEAGVLNSFAVNHAIQGKMDAAVLLLNEALSLNLEINNKAAVRNNYMTLFMINRHRGNLSEALKYNQAILGLAQESKNSRSVAEAYMQHADILTDQKNFEEAENVVLRKALPLYYYGLKDKLGTIKCYDQLGATYFQHKKFTEAKWFYIQSNMLARKINNTSEIVSSLINLAHVKMSIGDYELALSDIKEAEQLSVKNKYTNQLIEVKNDLAELYAKLGNSGAASLAHTEFRALKDALFSTFQ